MSFGANLEKLRKENKISQSKLGLSLGLTQQMISTYEKDLSSPNIDILIKLADYFNVSIDTLVGHVTLVTNMSTVNERMLRLFDSLCETDKERCILIVQTILNDRIFPNTTTMI